MADFWGTGSAPAGATGAVTEQASLPAWYQEYLRGSVNQAIGLSQTPQTTYTAPRVAGFTADTTNAFENTRDAQGNWQPAMSSGVSSAITGSTYNPNTFQNDFLNPNMSAVYDDMARRSNQNLNEKILPAVNNTFTGGGQFGSTRGMDFTNRAIRDQQDTLAGQMATAGQAAWDSSQKNYGDWATRGIQGGQALGNLAGQQQSAALKDASALDTIGRAQQQQTQANLDVAYGDFQNQQNYGKDNAAWLAGIIRGYSPPPTGQSAISGGTQQIVGQSPLAALAGGLGTVAASTQPAQNRKRGGLITARGNC
jgi:hypothetical protein